MSTEENFENLEESVEDTEQLEETTEEETLEQNDEAGEETEEESEDFDFDAELEALNENKKQNFENAKKRIESKKPKQDITDEAVVDKIVSRLKSELIADTAQDTLDAELSKLSDNQKKRDLIRFHYENSIVKSGVSRQSIINDLENALAITDKKMAAKRSSEFAQAKIAESTAGRGAGMGGGSSKMSSKEDYERYLSPSEIAFGKKRGWDKAMFQKAAAEIKNKKR